MSFERVTGKITIWRVRYFLITCYCLSYTAAISTVLDIAWAFNGMDNLLFAFKILLKRIFLNPLETGTKRGVKMQTRETPGELGRTELQNACCLHTPLRRLVAKSVTTGLLFHYCNSGSLEERGPASLPACLISLFLLVAGRHGAHAHCLNSTTMEEFSWKVKQAVCIGSVNHLASSRGLVALLSCVRLAFPCYVLDFLRK